MDRKKLTRFLWISLSGLICLCVLVFIGVTAAVIDQGTSTMNKVATSYMESMSIQIQNHFDTLVDMRMTQVRGIT